MKREGEKRNLSRPSSKIAFQPSHQQRSLESRGDHQVALSHDELTQRGE